METIERVLTNWDGLAGATWRPYGSGLVNTTFRVEAGGRAFALQKVSPIFDPRIHDTIALVTEHLAARGLATPRLVPTRSDERWLDAGSDGIWRLMTWLDGSTFDRVLSPEMAREAGTLVGAFHSTLEDLEAPLVSYRPGVHDTARHLARLEAAVAAHREHRLWHQVAPLADVVIELARSLPALPEDLPRRPAHGDLKLNNLVFRLAPDGTPGEALGLIDLDTLGPMPIAHELGDAWRSWCNPAGEDTAQTTFDLAVYEAAVAGYASRLTLQLSPDEVSSLLLGVEWITLELAARFAADALDESYFGWDASRFPGRGEHNLLRARGQLALHRSAVAARRERERALDRLC